MARLRFSRAEIDATVAAVENHMVFKDVQKMRTSKLKRFIARPTFEDEMELHRVDCMSSNGLVDNYEYLRAKQAEFASEPQPLIPQPLVSGHDLISMGHAPGPRFRDLLITVQNLQLEGAITTREQALQWLKEHATDLPEADRGE